MLCIVVLVARPFLVEPDDFAYRASIVGITEGHFLTLSAAQVHALAAHLGQLRGAGVKRRLGVGRSIVGPGPVPSRQPGAGPGPVGPSGTPMGAARQRPLDQREGPGLPLPRRALSSARLDPTRAVVLRRARASASSPARWRGSAATAAPPRSLSSARPGRRGLFAGVLHADLHRRLADRSGLWRPALGSPRGKEAGRGHRTFVGLLAFLAFETAVFVRYTDVVVLLCRTDGRRCVEVQPKHGIYPCLAWWLGSVVLFGAGVALFDDLVYGGPFKSGYGPGEITFSLSSILPNFRYMPAHLVEAMPMLFFGLGAVVWIVWCRVRLRGRLLSDELGASARCDFAVAVALAASWFSVWGCTRPTPGPRTLYGTTLQFACFYVPALGAISLLGAYPIVLCPEPRDLPGSRRVAVVVGIFALGRLVGPMPCVPTACLSTRDRRSPRARAAHASRPA